MLSRTEGIVLKELRYKETSKILTIFTEKYGIIHAMARGAYRPKSQLIANTQSFSLNEYNLYKGRNFYYINSAEVINSFYPLREDINRLMYGSFILELLTTTMAIEEANHEIYKLVKNSLFILSKLDRNYLNFITSFELKYISFLGYKPYLNSCVNCGEKNINKIKFSLNEGGILCENCFSYDLNGIIINYNLYKGLRFLLFKPLNEVVKTKIPRPLIGKLHEILVKYIMVKTERTYFKSLNIINSMPNL